jgi:UDP-N-acetylglucosamine 2-epimerase (non-hydrolysing)
MKIDLIAGARSNFMKIAPIIDAVNYAKSEAKKISFRLVHSGQHYEKNMRDSFFEQLGIFPPDVNFNAFAITPRDPKPFLFALMNFLEQIQKQ